MSTSGYRNTLGSYLGLTAAQIAVKSTSELETLYYGANSGLPASNSVTDHKKTLAGSTRKPIIGLTTGGQNQATFEARETSYGGTLGCNVTYLSYTTGVGMPELRSGVAQGDARANTVAGYYNGLFEWQFRNRTGVVPVICIRPDPKLDWAGGTQDADIDRFCAQILPGIPVVIPIWIEVDGFVQGRVGTWSASTGTVAQQAARIVEWQAMVKRIGDRIHAYGNANIKVAINIQSYAWNPLNTGNASDKGGGQYMTQFTYWTTAMASAVDIVSTNLYNGTGAAALATRVKMWTLETVMDPYEAFRQAAGKPGSIFEWGSWEPVTAATVSAGPLGGDTSQTKGEWLTDTYNYMLNHQAYGGYLYASAWNYLGYYGTAGTAIDDISALDSTPGALSAFQALRSDSRIPVVASGSINDAERGMLAARYGVSAGISLDDQRNLAYG